MNKSKDVLNDLDGFTTNKTSGLESAAKSFVSFAKEIKKAFDELQKVKTDNVSKIMSALSSIDLGKFRGIGTDIVKAMELGINNYTYSFTSAVNKIKQGLTFSATKTRARHCQRCC